jgi:oxygen-independent coproporphyrinogen-3 oxidase
LGLYLHIPFCSAICNYCNFNRGLSDAALKARYVTALALEIERAADGSPVDSIYFGGGTPSLLTTPEVATLLAACRNGFAVAPGAEITLEMNPETADGAYLAGIRASGVNRLSIGVQSFRDDELQRLGRIHSAARARAAVRDARLAGFDNLSLDLMMWLPGQSVAHWLSSVERLIELEPDHASLYLLEIYPNAPLRDVMARDGWETAGDDAAADMYLEGMARLDGAGYRQYEISNVARDGRFAWHNVKYWTDGEWLGLGCGAHGTRHAVRWRNVSGTEPYIESVLAGRPCKAEARELSTDAALSEALFMGLRLNGGIDVEEMDTRYGCDIMTRFGSALAPFATAGLVEIQPPALRLTRRGMLLANEILAVFV